MTKPNLCPYCGYKLTIRSHVLAELFNKHQKRTARQLWEAIPDESRPTEKSSVNRELNRMAKLGLVRSTGAHLAGATEWRLA